MYTRKYVQNEKIKWCTYAINQRLLMKKTIRDKAFIVALSIVVGLFSYYIINYNREYRIHQKIYNVDCTFVRIFFFSLNIKILIWFSDRMSNNNESVQMYKNYNQSIYYSICLLHIFHNKGVACVKKNN